MNDNLINKTDIDKSENCSPCRL